MKDGLPRSYDAWRTRNREDEDDIQEQRRRREEQLEDRADMERDRRKDELGEAKRLTKAQAQTVINWAKEKNASNQEGESDA